MLGDRRRKSEQPRTKKGMSSSSFSFFSGMDFGLRSTASSSSSSAPLEKGLILRYDDVVAWLKFVLEYDAGLTALWDEKIIKNGWTDYQLYIMTFWIILAFYIVCCIPYCLLDLFKLKQTDKERLQPGTYNSFSLMTKGAVLVLVVFFTTILPLQMCSGPFFEIAGINGTKPFPKVWQALLQLAIFFVVEDYGNYWIHRWLHTPWAYKHIHYMHHEFDTPTALAASYAHPIEVLVLGSPTFLGPAIVGCHVSVCWAWFVLRELEALETHSGYDFWWSPTKLIPFYGGSEYHDYHHWVGGKSRGNFASIFTYCDYIYGTDKGYRAEKRRLNGERLQHSVGSETLNKIEKNE